MTDHTHCEECEELTTVNKAYLNKIVAERRAYMDQASELQRDKEQLTARVSELEAPADTTLKPRVTVHIGTSCLSKDLVWCECGRGLSLNGKWTFCPSCGREIDQGSYVNAVEQATINGAYLYRDATSDKAILAVEADNARLRTALEELEERSQLAAAPILGNYADPAEYYRDLVEFEVSAIARTALSTAPVAEAQADLTDACTGPDCDCVVPCPASYRTAPQADLVHKALDEELRKIAFWLPVVCYEHDDKRYVDIEDVFTIKKIAAAAREALKTEGRRE